MINPRVASFTICAAFCLISGRTFAATAQNCKVTFKTRGQPVLINIEGKSEAPCDGTFTIDGDKFSASSFKMSLLQLDTGPSF